ncbi:MAG TPA: xanthine dehydrogenase subunit D [Streptosporangiaceae bacterium]|nr:xanthine dehydrogenase subunit D [Streptosporangiaceae bacterium]
MSTPTPVPVRPGQSDPAGDETSRETGGQTSGQIGASPVRPDGRLKVTGEFAYGSDLVMDDMIWGVTLRSPHPHARIKSVKIGEALATAGVYAVLTCDDVPGENAFGLEHADQPVLAADLVRYAGEPVALVAADHPEVARRAASKIVVDYEPLEPVIDAEAALDATAPALHPGGNLVRHLKVRKGDPNPTADVVVKGTYQIGMQDQAFLGPEAGLAVPDGEGGVDLFVSTQWLHVDQRQICAALGLPLEKVRLTLAGVGGAFGGREDLSMHVHACLLALHTGKPVKMVYSREESFFGHVHRHPAVIRFEHGANKDGTLVYVKAQIHLDGGAYASSTPAVVANAGLMSAGPYVVPNVHVDTYGVYTNNPPCGAMRGFGNVQAAFGYEAQMDKVAAALGLDPLDFRCQNAMEMGSSAPTGQVIDSPAPVVELLRRVERMPLPAPASAQTENGGSHDLRHVPGGVGNTTHGEGIKRGIGYAVGYKNVGFSEGFDDYSTARVRLEIVAGDPVATVHTAAAEVGQGLVTIEQQIARTELGVSRVVIVPKDTAVGSAGSTSASRQTYVTGGAVKAACESVREQLFDLVRHRLEQPDAQLRLADDQIWQQRGPGPLGGIKDFLGDQVLEDTLEWRHRPTEPVDPETGQGFAHVQYAFAAHRAVVDVDTELGLIKVVALDCAQDVGRALNPQAVVGQIQGGSAQGLGLAVMEEIQVSGGMIKNPSFTDYLIPTILDVPPMRIDVLEYPDPHAPYGVRGVGEPPTISSGPAIVAAIRAATGLDLDRVPVRPQDIAITALR